MAYAIIDIVNLGLGHIGQPKIASLSEDSVAAIQATLNWPYVRDEVLASADWSFATVRAVLALNTTAPTQGYDYAYTLPSDFLRVCQDKNDDPVVTQVSSVAVSEVEGSINLVGQSYGYAIEALPDGTRCLFTNYDNSTDDLVLRYVRREENPSRYSPHFITAAAFRMGAALAPVLTESTKKFENMMALYAQAMRAAKSHNRSSNFVKNETGSDSWTEAGR